MDNLVLHRTEDAVSLYRYCSMHEGVSDDFLLTPPDRIYSRLPTTDSARKQLTKDTNYLQLIYKSQSDAHQAAHHPAAVHSSSGQKAIHKSYTQFFFQPLTPANMRFNGLIASVLAITAAAAPNGLVKKQDNITSTLYPLAYPRTPHTDSSSGQRHP